jgi:hypothetical protein
MKGSRGVICIIGSYPVHSRTVAGRASGLPARSNYYREFAIDYYASEDQKLTACDSLTGSQNGNPG